MTNLKNFIDHVKQIDWPDDADGQMDAARKVVTEINRYLFTSHPGIGTTTALDREFSYFSEFHKLWEQHNAQILDLTVHIESCEKVAEALHNVFVETNGRAFNELADVYDTCGLTSEQFCTVRLLTANQDFRDSLEFGDLAAAYNRDPTIFDLDRLIENPDAFLAALHLTRFSQTDKRSVFAKTFSQFVKRHGGSPIGLLANFGNDLYALRTAMINCQGAGYGAKKTDMVLRDMVVQNVWPDAHGFDKINVASDRNTIKVALRTGILRSSIPLVSSFLDQFCSQYSLVDEKTAEAWRCVWGIWSRRYPDQSLKSPCQLDYFIYDAVGRQFCKTRPIQRCENGHELRKLTAQTKKCPRCHRALSRVVNVLPCDDAHGEEFIRLTDFVQSGRAPIGMSDCPFKDICAQYMHKNLEPPKSISILGETGWDSAWASVDAGGGGLMRRVQN